MMDMIVYTLAIKSEAKPAAATFLTLLEVYIRSFTDELVKMSPAARKPMMAI